MKALKRYLNRITSPEGCTAIDAMKLRDYNHGLAEESQEFRDHLSNLIHCLDEYGFMGRSMQHPRITKAVDAARRLLDQAVEREL